MSRTADLMEAFMYHLLRDVAPMGEINRVVKIVKALRETETEVTYTSEPLLHLAKDLVDKAFGKQV